MSGGGVTVPHAKDKQIIRILRFLAAGPASVERSANPDQLVLSSDARGRIGVSSKICQNMVSNGLLLPKGDRLTLQPAGRAFLKDGGKTAGTVAGRHGDIECRTVETDTGIENVSVNLAESPLGRVARMKNASGAAFLDAAEFRAGERLRRDFTRAQMEPRLGVNWDVTAVRGVRSGPGDAAELGHAALSARRRVTGALDAVGPELSGILLDVCCFLKGLSVVECERGWPARSAKIVLKTALGVLARHYNPKTGSQGKARDIMHWGAPGYRPEMPKPNGSD